MPLTFRRLKKTGRLHPHSNGKKGCFSILPPLRLKCLKSGGHPHAARDFFSGGDVVYATSFKQRDVSQGEIHLRGIGLTWPLHLFEVQSQLYFTLSTHAW